MLCIALVSSPTVAGDAARGVGEQALSLMRRILTVEFPQTLPPSIKRSLPQEIAGEVAEAYDQADNKAAQEFWAPVALKALDRRLYRDLKKFWKRPPEVLFAALPELLAAYQPSDPEMRVLISQTFLGIVDEGPEVLRERAVEIEPILRELLESDCGLQTKERAIAVYGRPPILFVNDAHLFLIDFIKTAEGPVKFAAIQRLSYSARFAEVRSSLREPVLEWLGDSECPDCQLSAMATWNIVDQFGFEDTMPLLLGILDDICERTPTMAQVLARQLTLAGRAEAMPGLVRALDCHHPTTRATFVVTLAALSPEVKVISRRYGVDALEYLSPTPERQARLAEAVREVKAWWRQEGASASP